MRQSHATHPSAKVLKAFAQGLLRPEDADKVQRHLTTCEACRQAVTAPPRGETVLGAQPPDTRSGSDPGPGAGAGQDAVPAELAGHPKFRVLRLLGKGGMGAVYLAEHRLMKRQIAIKIINRLLVEDPDAISRFLREIEAVSRLDHPHIARAHDAEQAGDLHLLVMEYVPGHDLEEVVRARGPLSTAAACLCLRQVAEGLRHAFAKGMVHRDLKPTNLRVTAEGVVKILDFGLAKLARERQGGGLTGAGLTRENALMGTPDYIAPEQATDAQKADIRADIYSLGCTGYFLLTGRPPFPDGTDMQKILAHLDKQPTPLRELRPEVPPELEAVIARMMAKQPGDRFQTPAEVVQALAKFGAAAKPPAPEQAPRQQAAESPRPEVIPVAENVATAPIMALAATEAWRPLSPSENRSQRARTWVAVALGLVTVLAGDGLCGWPPGPLPAGWLFTLTRPTPT